MLGRVGRVCVSEGGGLLHLNTPDFDTQFFTSKEKNN